MSAPKVGDLNGPDFEGPTCDAVSPEQYGCTMRPDHDGPHVAEGSTHVLAVWGQPEPARTVPDRDTIARTILDHRGVDLLFLDRQRCLCGMRPPERTENFRAWLSAHQADELVNVLSGPSVAQVQAQALREAANEYGPGQLTFFGTPQQYTAAWLHARANAIEAGVRP